MCGILGSINIEISNSLLDTIAHRGPDDSGIETFSINNNFVCLAHRRLSIVDLSPSGHQPMFSQDNNDVIIFNGEIYNHLALRNKMSNYSFIGSSDTETILQYLKNNGIKGLADLNGIFAIAWLDKINSKLYLARDAFGVKPLYFHTDGQKLIFSSEIRPIKQIVKLEIDKNNLATLLRLRYLPSPNTLYSSVYKLQPGHYIELDLSKNDKLEMKQISFVNRNLNKQKISFDEAVEKYGEYINKAVERQLMSDVEVGILLSGGIDSAVVASLAQKHYPKPMKAFTIGFEGNYNVDEIEKARYTAKVLGLEHYTSKISNIDFLSTFKECSRIVEEPLATTSIIPMYFLAKQASEQVKVVLSGQGADEPLGGYDRYQGELISERFPKFLLNIAGKGIKLSGTKNEILRRASTSSYIKDDVERFASVYSVFTPDEIYQLTGILEKKAIDLITYNYNLLKCKQQKHSVDRMISIDLRMNLADDLLLYTDKITMNFALECRVPMLDLELINYIESLPTEYKLKFCSSKLVHKAFAKSILPLEIINRTKFAFQSPTNLWFREKANELQDLLCDTNSKFSKILNIEAVKSIFAKHNRGYNYEKQIFLLLGIYYWLEENI